MRGPSQEGTTGSDKAFVIFGKPQAVKENVMYQLAMKGMLKSY